MSNQNIKVNADGTISPIDPSKPSSFTTDMNNLDKQIDQILNNTGCDCYHYTSCEIISNTKIAKAAIQQLLVAERIATFKQLQDFILLDDGSGATKAYIDTAILALQSQLTNGGSV